MDEDKEFIDLLNEINGELDVLLFQVATITESQIDEVEE